MKRKHLQKKIIITQTDLELVSRLVKIISTQNFEPEVLYPLLLIFLQSKLKVIYYELN